MLRVMFVCLALSGFGATAQAGELDRDAGPAKAAVVAPAAPATQVAVGSEMDRESPTVAYYRRGGWGGYRGGYRGYYGGYRGYGYRGYYGGWGYPAYYGGWGYPYYGYGGYSPWAGGYYGYWW